MSYDTILVYNIQPTIIGFHEGVNKVMGRLVCIYRRFQQLFSYIYFFIFIFFIFFLFVKKYIVVQVSIYIYRRVADDIPGIFCKPHRRK